MSTEERRKCVTCGKNLKKQNTSDKCAACKAAAGEYGKPRGAKPSQKKNAAVASEVDELPIRERFEQLARGLGKDPLSLIENFCEGWVANIQQAAEKALNPDD